MAAQHDLRRKAQRLTDLHRKHAAHEKLSEAEMSELRIGITDEEEIKEYTEIIESIRGERRGAQPSRKTRAVKDQQELRETRSKPIDLNQFLNKEHDTDA